MASVLPDYVATAKPVPPNNRVAWYKCTAQTYASIMLWFVFWQDIPTGGGALGGTLAQGLTVAFSGLVLAALLCHFLYYLVPGLLGLKTGLPLHIVGTSTYGVRGGRLLPAFFMGLFQFAWLGINAFFVARFLCAPFYGNDPTAAAIPHALVAVAWCVLAALLGLKASRYVAKVARFLPLIPLGILLMLFVGTVDGINSFDCVQLAGAATQAAAANRLGPMPSILPIWGVVNLLVTYIIGFFAVAGAAGADLGMHNRNEDDIQLGGLVGVAGIMILTGGLSLLIVAGAFAKGLIADPNQLQTTSLMTNIVGARRANFFLYLLALTAFPGSCFSVSIAANSLKTTLPKISPILSVGTGTLASILLAVTGWAGDVLAIFSIMGACFGPICGAMAADFLLSHQKWAGPRAGFNPAGWISWAAGFVVGAANFLPGLAGQIPVPPLAAFIVGFLLYVLLAKLRLQSQVIAQPTPVNEPALTSTR